MLFKNNFQFHSPPVRLAFGYRAANIKVPFSFDTFPETNIFPWKVMVGVKRPFWEGIFSGSMLVSGSVLQPKKILKSLARLSSVHLETSPVHLHIFISVPVLWRTWLRLSSAISFLENHPKKYSYSKNSWWRYPSFACCGATSGICRIYFRLIQGILLNNKAKLLTFSDFLPPQRRLLNFSSAFVGVNHALVHCLPFRDGDTKRAVQETTSVNKQNKSRSSLQRGGILDK